MKIGTKLYVADRKAWRAWLKEHHATAKDVWLVYYKKQSGKQRIPYNDAVDEALCFGWIDSILKPIDEETYAQRFSPRKSGSKWSALNIERLRKLLAQKKVTRAGLRAASPVLNEVRSRPDKKSFEVPPDILKELKGDPVVWKNFSRFPLAYKRIRIGWIDSSREVPGIFRQRLGYFLRMTAQNKRFGMVR